MTSHLMLMSHVVILVITSVAWTLVIAPVVNISLLTLMLSLMVEASSIHTTSLTTTKASIERLRSSLLATRTLIELESRFEQHSEQINQVLRAIETGYLCLVLLILLLVLRSLVHKLFISNESHLFWVAVLNIEGILRLEQHIASKVFCHFALILLLEVNKSLLGSRNDLNFGYFSLTSGRKVYFQLLLCSSDREVFDKETEEHNRLLVLEICHHQLMLPLSLLLCLADVEISHFATFDRLKRSFSFFSGWFLSQHSLNCLFSRRRICIAYKTKLFRRSLSVTHDAAALNWTKLFKELLQIRLLEIHRDVLHIDIVECLCAETRFLALVFKHLEYSLSLISVRAQVILVHLQQITKCQIKN